MSPDGSAPKVQEEKNDSVQADPSQVSISEARPERADPAESPTSEPLAASNSPAPVSPAPQEETSRSPVTPPPDTGETSPPLVGRKRKHPEPVPEEAELVQQNLSIQLRSGETTPAPRSRTSSVSSPQSLPPSPMVPSPYLQPMAPASSEVTAALLDPVASIKMEQAAAAHHHALASSATQPQLRSHTVSPALVPVTAPLAFSSAAAALSAVPSSTLPIPPSPNLSSPTGSGSPDTSAAASSPPVAPTAPTEAIPPTPAMPLTPKQATPSNSPDTAVQADSRSSAPAPPAADTAPREPPRKRQKTAAPTPSTPSPALEEPSSPRPEVEASLGTDAQRTAPPEQAQQKRPAPAPKPNTQPPREVQQIQQMAAAVKIEKSSSPAPTRSSMDPSIREASREGEGAQTRIQEVPAKIEEAEVPLFQRRTKRAAAIVAADNIKRSESADGFLEELSSPTSSSSSSSSSPSSSSPSASSDSPEPSQEGGRRSGGTQPARARGRRGRGTAAQGQGRGPQRAGRGGSRAGSGNRSQTPEISPSSSSSSDSDVREEEEEEDDSVTRCVCGDNDDVDGFMICCERCEVWQHGECVNVDPKNVPDKYYCELCEPDHPIHQERRRLEAEIARARQLHEQQQKAAAQAGRGGRRGGRKRSSSGASSRRSSGADSGASTAAKDAQPPAISGPNSNSKSAPGTGERKRKRSQTIPTVATGAPVDPQQQSLERLRRAKARELRLQRQEQERRAASSGDSGSESGDSRRRRRRGRSSRERTLPVWAGNNSLYHTKLRLPTGPSEEERRQAQLDLAFQMRKLHPLAPMYFGRKHFILGPPPTTTAAAMHAAKRAQASDQKSAMPSQASREPGSGGSLPASVDWRNYREHDPIYLRRLAEDETLPFNRRICMSYFAEQLGAAQGKQRPTTESSIDELNKEQGAEAQASERKSRAASSSSPAAGVLFE